MTRQAVIDAITAYPHQAILFRDFELNGGNVTERLGGRTLAEAMADQMNLDEDEDYDYTGEYRAFCNAVLVGVTRIATGVPHIDTMHDTIYEIQKFIDRAYAVGFQVNIFNLNTSRYDPDEFVLMYSLTHNGEKE